MSDALDLSRLTKFSAFAERCERTAAEQFYYCEHAGTEGACDSVIGAFITQEDRKLAARHARLLEAVYSLESRMSRAYLENRGKDAVELLAEVLRLLREEK